MNLNLLEILNITFLNAQFIGDKQILDRNISNVSINSRTITPGELLETNRCIRIRVVK